MKLLLKRVTPDKNYSIGHLYIDGEYFCDTLEDKDRGLFQEMSKSNIESIKIYGKTAIPTGQYKITLNIVSPRFAERSWAKPYGGKVPRILNVKGFDGVLIHPGNSIDDTLGCILVGQNKQVGKVLNSQETFHKLYKRLLEDKDNIWITING